MDKNKENNLWKLAGGIFLIFGAPAILAGIVSVNLSGGKKVLILGSAFILSWIIFIFRYREIIK